MILGIFPPQFFAPEGYYRLVKDCDVSVTDISMRAERNFKSAHRCTIESRDGTAMLSCAVAKFDSRATWADVSLSSHGQWWEKHLQTLATNYGSSPFFSFYQPVIERLLSHELIEKMPSVAAYDCAIDAEIRHILDLPPQGEPSLLRAALDCLRNGEKSHELIYKGTHYTIKDFRNTDFSKIPCDSYQQPWREPFTCLPFTPGLSILDRIFCAGAEF